MGLKQNRTRVKDRSSARIHYSKLRESSVETGSGLRGERRVHTFQPQPAGLWKRSSDLVAKERAWRGLERAEGGRRERLAGNSTVLELLAAVRHGLLHIPTLAETMDSLGRPPAGALGPSLQVLSGYHGALGPKRQALAAASPLVPRRLRCLPPVQLPGPVYQAQPQALSARPIVYLSWAR